MLALPDLSIRQLEYLVAIAEQPTWADAAAHVEEAAAEEEEEDDSGFEGLGSLFG